MTAAAVVVQLAVLYWPRPQLPPGPEGADVVVHVLVFAATAFPAVRAGLAVPAVVAVLVGHAVVSEVLQHLVVPGRSGDPFDALADVVGVLAGVVLAQVVSRVRRDGGRGAGP